ncbi:hypothetical protein [Caballeronia terrestris]|jgi:hypothetical protein|uniref:hypothetical protein n=1 Tax=Caballeronia terrestris TaxID=1226301 RepID=UPI000B3E57E6|nr:hypothetical protein [Caballeronia terrestris]
MKSISARVIDFLGDLHAMDHMSLTPPRNAVIDLQSGIIYEEHADWPDGERLSAELPLGKKITVSTHKLMQHLIVRHAEAMAVIENTKVRAQYDGVCDQLSRKTGFGE